MTVPDAIEREVQIAAPIDRVWALVSEPGWWINEGTIRPHKIEERDGGFAVTDEEHGEFLVRLVDSQEPHAISFGWLVNGDAENNSQNTDESNLVSTVTAFTLEEVDGGTRVRVVESGFATSDRAAEVRQRAYDENTEGWEIELKAAKSHLEGA
ncbi:SRPBCC domain-containing protein [Luteipulveratus mongoliensis]|uniref:Activator of Hsp90 ATPase homologue 1/2-like C-terminal domain-containing protein n=1 Tax=Luteipulveratus mongoliensis TaxID=571913 RepID=A0A0K1JEV9_9MICO|nr:SRPBCC domain-containing protein [Luteipulveratus mongoliensis]AKU15247.1 hypothetical protein VV02_04190 [Luteipulveratus mongoliensis]